MIPELFARRYTESIAAQIVDAVVCKNVTGIQNLSADEISSSEIQRMEMLLILLFLFYGCSYFVQW